MKVTITAYKRRKQRMDFVLAEGETIIGRSSECDLCVNDSRVSRKHCKLIVSGETTKVIDLASQRGTYVNGRRVAEAELTDGGRLSIGRIYFKIDIEPTADAPPSRKTPPHPA